MPKPPGDLVLFPGHADDVAVVEVEHLLRVLDDRRPGLAKLGKISKIFNFCKFLAGSFSAVSKK